MGRYLMEKNYLICDKVISIKSPRPITEHENFKIFATGGGSADIRINYSIVEKLPAVPVSGTKSGNGTTVSFDGTTVCRNTPMGTAEGALSRYVVGDTSESNVFFTEGSYSTMSDFRYMWNSVSLSQLLLPFNVLLFHSSYIAVDGGAILFSGSCGVGKSTQAELWRKHKGAEVINGDKAGVSVKDGEVYAHGLPFCGTSGICKNRTLPLKAIVLLSQSSENTVSRAVGVEAIQSLLKNIYLDFLVPGETQMCVDTLIQLLGTVPVYRLGCTPDERAVKTLATQLHI